jgi:hypothetical protein
MAECLADRKIDPEYFHSVFVPDEETKNRVLTLLEESRRPKDSFYVSVNNNIFV